METTRNDKFEIMGVNHLALVCKDMQRTVDFYSGVLGMPLTKTIDLPNGAGQHFFFDIGNGDSLAFFWFPDAPDAVPGVTHPASLVGRGSITTAHASLNHLAFNVAAERIEEYRERLAAAGVDVTPVVNHDDSERQASMELTPSTFVRSIYFLDPDGIQLEFAAWTRPMGQPGDVRHAPATADDRARYLKMRPVKEPAE
ncbi:MAG: VOC family protein [Alphaproteobacteria bacterium]|nr:VOC family protein [Alphaproteobacteria bacterium]